MRHLEWSNGTDTELNQVDGKPVLRERGKQREEEMNGGRKRVGLGENRLNSQFSQLDQEVTKYESTYISQQFSPAPGFLLLYYRIHHFKHLLASKISK